jgi:transposase
MELEVCHGRNTREFKVEAVKLVPERGVAVKQAARDLNVHPNVLHRWMKDFAADPQHAFPGKGQMKPEQLEIGRLRREVQRLEAERDILRKAARPPLRPNRLPRPNPYIQRDIHEKTGLGEAGCVGAGEAHNANTVLAAADLHNCAL